MIILLSKVVGVWFFGSDTGEIYAKKLANFVEKRLKNERAASVSNVYSVYFWVDYSLTSFA